MSTIDPAPADHGADASDAAVLAVDGVTGLFPAQGTLGLVSDRLVAAVTGAPAAAPGVSVRPEAEATLVSARIGVSARGSARVCAARVADTLLALHPDQDTLVRVQVARIG